MPMLNGSSQGFRGWVGARNFGLAGPTRVVVRGSIQPCSRQECVDAKKLMERIMDENGLLLPNYITDLCTVLPTYVMESYVEILKLWKKPRHRDAPTLVELCLRRIGRVVPAHRVVAMGVMPRLNHIIHRSFRRMLDRYREASIYEAFWGDAFRTYPGSNGLNGIDLWFNRSNYLKRQTCPVERVRDYLRVRSEQDNVYMYTMPDYIPRSQCRLNVHQCGYFRCTCQAIQSTRAPPEINSHHLAPRHKKKVVDKATRAAQRAERRRRY